MIAILTYTTNTLLDKLAEYNGYKDGQWLSELEKRLTDDAKGTVTEGIPMELEARGIGLGTTTIVALVEQLRRRIQNNEGHVRAAPMVPDTHPSHQHLEGAGDLYEVDPLKIFTIVSYVIFALVGLFSKVAGSWSSFIAQIAVALAAISILLSAVVLTRYVLRRLLRDKRS